MPPHSVNVIEARDLLNKFRSEPLADRPVRATLGFDIELSERLERIGFRKVVDVFVTFLRLNRNLELYRRWLRTVTSEESRIDYSFQFFNDWCNRNRNPITNTSSVSVQTV